MDPRLILTRGVSTGLRLGRGTADRVVRLAGPPLGRLTEPGRLPSTPTRGRAPRRRSRRRSGVDRARARGDRPLAGHRGPQHRPAAPDREARPAGASPGASPARSCHLRGPARHSQRVSLPDPAVVVLVGPSGSGKSTWAAAHYRREEVVSSDALRGVVGSGPHDLDATADAFDAARAGRRRPHRARPDHGRRHPGHRRDPAAAPGWRRAREVGLPAVVVVMDTPDAECRRRNAARDRPVPAPTLAGQLKRHRALVPQLELEGWDVVHVVGPSEPGRVPEPAPDSGLRHTTRTAAERRTSQGLKVVLQVSRFPWGEEPLAWLTRRGPGRRRGRLRRALGDGPPDPDPAGRPGLVADPGAVGDPRRGGRAGHRPRARHPGHAGHLPRAGHHRQGRGHPGRAHRRPGLRRRRRRLVGARARGVRAGVPAAEAAARRPRARDRDDAGAVGARHQGVRRRAGQPPGDDLLPAAGRRRSRSSSAAPDRAPCGSRPRSATPPTCRRPGRGSTSTSPPCAGTPRPCGSPCSTCPRSGTDREDAWARVERLRGRTPAAAYAQRTHAGTVADQRDRWGGLADLGVDTVFLGVADLESPDDVDAAGRTPRVAR